MNMKAIMFAGSGLFLSMVATTMWISADMAKIRERELAKRQAECALQSTTTSTPSGVPGASGAAPSGGIDPVTGQPIAATPGTPANTSCSAGQADASAQTGAIDPATGQPLVEDTSFSSEESFSDPDAEPTFDESASSGDPGF